MTNLIHHTSQFFDPLLVKMNAYIAKLKDENSERAVHPFWAIVHKEISDHVRSWRFIILMV